MRRIVILDQSMNDQGNLVGDVLFRLDVPPALQKPAPTAVSKDLGATTVETTALQAGTVTEIVYAVDPTPPAVPVAYVEQQLVNHFTDLQVKLNAKVPVKTFAGGVWDGSVWTGMPAT
jgi:hypothetical protein